MFDFWKKKDHDLVTELYELYQKAMFYEAKNILRDNALAEDAVHSAFERVMKNLHKVKENPPHKTKRFLVIIVRNVSIDMYNKIKNQDTTPIDNLYSLGDTRADIEKMYITKETYEIAMNELKKMPRIYSDTFELKHNYDFSNKEIAHFLNINEPTIRKRLQIIREKLRIALGEK